MVSATKVICDVYKSGKEGEMFLYVKKQDGLARVPEALMQRFGKAVHVMTMIIEPGKKLARTTSEKVLSAIDEQGFFLQMPPQKDAYMQEVNQNNEKLSR